MSPVRIAAVTDDPAALSIGPRRVFETICTDERFALTAFITLPGAAPRKVGVFPFVMGIDAQLFARPRAFEAPAFEASVDAIPTKHLDAVTAGGIEYDVILDFSEAGAPAALADSARFGLWRLTSFDRNAGFDDIASPASNVDLLRIPNATELARRVGTASYNVKITAARNAAFIREKSAQLLIRELRRLADNDAPEDLGPCERRNGRAPGVADIAAYGVRLGLGLGKRGFERVAAKAGFRPGMFFLKYGKGGPLDFDPAAAVDIFPPGNRYWADPFLIENDGETFLFFEDYGYADDRGHISVGKIDDGGFSFIGPALRADYHLSYPFVFRHDDALFMLPETSQSERIEIWRSSEFPCGWELCATALEGTAAADSALLHHDGAWWLFTNITNDSYGDHCAELHLYRVDGPMLRRHEPHPLNPVVIDTQTARGAGRVFAVDGRLFRLSQDNAYGTYGYGLNVMEITRLDMSGYNEHKARYIAPDFEPRLIGCHHADFAGGMFVMDVRRDFGGRG